jgi:hypothetical protein
MMVILPPYLAKKIDPKKPPLNTWGVWSNVVYYHSDHHFGVDSEKHDET